MFIAKKPPKGGFFLFEHCRQLSIAIRPQVGTGYYDIVSLFPTAV
jgi:hypothetical protein